MTVYTYKGNKNPREFVSLLKFSTGRDMVVGEALDITAQELTEATRTGANMVLGNQAATYNGTNFPTPRIYIRPAPGAPATAKKT